MQYILAGIDGTSSRESRPRHGTTHVLSFCNDFDKQGGRTHYFNGPDEVMTGGDSPSILRDVVDWIRGRYRDLTTVTLPLAEHYDDSTRQDIFRSNDERVRIVLVGHSRGGYIAIRAAATILGPPIHFMGLYDAVDRTLGPDATTIRNVRTTYHAIRAPQMGSRSEFGNTGPPSAPVCRPGYVSADFRTSHGGIGGTPEEFPVGMRPDYTCTDLVRRPGAAVHSRRPGRTGGAYDHCLEQSRAADSFIRQGARSVGLRFLR